MRCSIALLLGALMSASVGAADESRRPNVLFIAVDDLRPELACYGRPEVQSPHIDRLAASGLRFERAYCTISVCGASRASLMTSVRPSRNRFVGYLARADRDAPGTVTMNTHFKQHGYHTVSLGKVFHVPADNEHGWSEPPWRPANGLSYKTPENQQLHDQRAPKRGPPYESADAPESLYADGQVADEAVARLRQLKNRSEPFLLAVGFFKPHLPFVAPKKYWDLYDARQVQLPDNYHPPQDAPAQAIHSWGELRAYAGVPAQGPLDDDLARTLIHGYRACVSFTDAQIGKLLDELERLELANSTIVVLWSDHGWNLGEHTLWCKHSCFETSMRIPLIVRAPGQASGASTPALVTSIDLYPTLCELAGIPIPEHVEGRSLATLLRDPTHTWSDSAVGRFGNGDTIRTDRHRFTEYTTGAGQRQAIMLYDHQTDPQENVNLAGRAELAAEVERLNTLLQQLKGRDRPRRAATKR